MQATRGTAVAGEVDQPTRRTAARVAVGIAAAVVLGADEISKAIVVAKLQPDQPKDVLGTFLRLDLTRNPGAAFSIGTGSTIVFSVVAIVVAIIIVRTARQLTSLGWGVALGLLLGGALGNLSDRIFRAPSIFQGHVVDWIELPHWPVFNLADSAITVGAVLAVVLSLIGVRLIAEPSVGDAESAQ